MEKEVKEIQKTIGCDAGSVWMRDDDDDDVLYPYIFLGEHSDKLEGMELDVNTGVCGYCVRNSKEFITNDMSKETQWYSGADEKTGFVTKSMICLPIIIDDYCMGCVQLLNKPGGFSNEDIEAARKIVKIIEDEM